MTESQRGGSRTILAAVADRLSDRAATASDPRLTAGDGVLMVEASDPTHGRLAGLAHRPAGDADSFDGRSVSGLAKLATAGETDLERAVGVATLNALSGPEMDWQVGDPMAALSADVDVVATVGLFRPAFRKFDDVDVRVVERDPPGSVEAPAGVSVTTYAPDECDAAFDGADVCFVTGSTLVYGGVGRYLSALSAASVDPVVLVGATASHLPDPAFDAGVAVVAGAQVTDAERVRERVAAGDCGTDLHDEGVRKVYVARTPTPDTLAGLRTAPDAESRTDDAATHNTELDQ